MFSFVCFLVFWAWLLILNVWIANNVYCDYSVKLRKVWLIGTKKPKYFKYVRGMSKDLPVLKSWAQLFYTINSLMLGTALKLPSACRQSAKRKVTEGRAPECQLLKSSNRPNFTHVLHPKNPTATRGSTWWATPISYISPTAQALTPQGRGVNTWQSHFWSRSVWQDHECARANRSAR